MHTRKSLLAMAIAAAMACVALPASAQLSAAMKVTATITPAACRIMLNETEIDKGTISAKDLHPTNFTMHGGTHQFTVTTNCDAAASTYIKFVDDRAGTAIGGDQNVFFGVGTTTEGTKIGRYMISSVSGGTEYDGKTGKFNYSRDGGATWRALDASIGVSKNTWGGVAADVGSAPPIAAETVNYLFNLTPLEVNNLTEMPVTSEVKADGQFTVELHTL